jgi:hypothetical protein
MKSKNHGEAGRQSLATAATGPRNLENADMSIIHERPDWGNHPPDPAVEVRLTGLLHENGQLFAVFAAGDSERIIEAELYQILPFENFRQHVYERFALRTVYHRGRWFADVIDAAERGGIAIEVDDLTRCIWLNDRQLSYAEAGYAASVMLSPVVRLAAKLGVAG